MHLTLRPWNIDPITTILWIFSPQPDTGIMASVFEYLDYRKFLAHSTQERGQRSRMAEAIRCDNAYLSRVLKGKADLNLEQAELASRQLAMNEDELHFLLLLVQLNRAGTADLKIYFKRQIQALHEKRLSLKNRLQYKKKLSHEDQSTYYSAWYYSAIHVMISIPAFQTKEALATSLNLTPRKIAKVLEFLTQHGLAQEHQGKFQVRTTSIHLGNDSPMISKHHTNWRMRAIDAIDSEEGNDLHYSSVVSLSREDVPKLRALLVKAIEDARAIIKPSKDEVALCYCVDAFLFGKPR